MSLMINLRAVETLPYHQFAPETNFFLLGPQVHQADALSLVISVENRAQVHRGGSQTATLDPGGF